MDSTDYAYRNSPEFNNTVLFEDGAAGGAGAAYLIVAGYLFAVAESVRHSKCQTPVLGRGIHTAVKIIVLACKCLT